MKQIIRISARIGLWLTISVVGLILLLIVGIQFPYIQQKLINAATYYVSGKTHTRVEIGRIGIAFPKNVVLENVFAEDLQHDTLLNIRKLSVGMEMFQLLRGKIAIDDVNLDGGTATIYRTLPDSSFNFAFLIDAFSSKNKATSSAQKEDTTTSSVNLQVNTIVLSDIHFVYKDAVSGISTNASIGRLDLNMQHINLAKLEFKANQLAITESDIEVTIEKSGVEKSGDTTTSVLPILGMESVTLNNVHFAFNNKPDSFSLHSTIGQLVLKPEWIDLNNQQIIINQLKLHQSAVEIATIFTSPDIKNTPIDTSTVSSGWKIAVKTTDLKENSFTYDVNNITKLKQGIDYHHLAVHKLNLQAQNLSYTADQIKGNIKQLALTEQSGLDLRKLHTEFIYDDTHIELANLLVQTPNTFIADYAAIEYPSLSSLSENIEQLYINVNFDQTRISMQDVLLFAPGIKTEEFINRNKSQFVRLDGKIIGPLNNLDFEKCIVRTATQTALAFSGSIQGLPDPKKLKYNIRLKSLISSQDDIAALLPNNMLPTSIAIPRQFKVSGTTTGSLNDNRSDVKIESTSGFAHIVSAIDHLNTTPNYSVAANTEKFDIGHLLKQPLIGTVTGNVQGKGTDFDITKLTANLSAQFDEIEVNKYGYRNIQMIAKADTGIYTATVTTNDTALKFTLLANASLRNNQTKADIDLTVAGANLKTLHLTKESIKTSGRLIASIQQQDSNDVRGNLSIGNVVVVKNDRKYILDSLVALSVNAKRNNSLSVNHSIVKISYKGETGLAELGNVMQQYVSHIITNPTTITDTLSQSFTCSVQVNPHPFLNEVLLPKLTQFEGLTLEANYASRQQALMVKMNAPIIEYDNQNIRGLAVNIDGNKDKIDYRTSISSFTSGSVSIPRTILSGNMEQQITTYKLQILEADSGYKLMLAGEINSADKDRISIRFTNDAILNNTKWFISKQNEIVLSPNGVNIQHLELKHNDESINLSSTSLAKNAPIDIQFNQFELGTLSRIIEKDSAIVRGLLQGDFKIQSIDQFAFTSDLKISGLAYKSINIGDLTLKANNLTANKYEGHLALVGTENKATIDGFFQNGEIDLALQIAHINVRTIEAFIPDLIKRSEGYVSGNMNISGKASQPKLDGLLEFNNASFHLTAVNNRLLMRKEQIKIDEHGVYFKNFTVLDSTNQPLVVNGSVLTSNFINMKFSMDITTDNFMVLNTTATQNPIYYGTILLSSKIKIRGTEILPDINADVKLLSGSKFTFVVQEGALNTDRGDGVVLFVDSSQTNIMTADTLAVVAALRGIDFKANIEVDRQTQFKIITDKISGDNLTVTGGANLNFELDASGKMSLIGMYTLNEGNYKASFQNVVKRNFNIKKGSTITWNGDPLDAQLDITAVYTTRTSATDLMATEIQGMHEAQRAMYRKLLYYDVDLIIAGHLLKPKLNFHLDMPIDKERAIFGNDLPYAKINEINANENELNKQVFALLVLNRFLPTGQGSTTSEAVSAIARNSVNQLLSDQMNKLSGKYIKGAELNFNLQSNDDYSSTVVQQNTELQIGLKKELLNNRLSVQVGSNIEVSNPTQQTSQQNITGDVVTEYKITNDGVYRAKAFMENSYEGVIDGNLYKSGVGIMYTRDYNHFSELFKIKKEQDSTKTQEQSK